MARRTQLLEEMHHWIHLRDTVGGSGFFQKGDAQEGVAEFLDKFDIQRRWDIVLYASCNGSR
jgi:hypothetical protein